MLIINIAGVILIALIIWWFWLYKPKAEQVGNEDLVVVIENGVYKPSHILMDGNERFYAKMLLLVLKHS